MFIKTSTHNTFQSTINRAFISILLVITIGFPHALLAQFNAEKVDAMDNYIEFLNASVHGLSIAQVIFVNYNKVINQYVDINSHELTQISNKDLPQNIFGGSDAFLNFYDQSDTPEALAQKAKSEGLILEIKLASTLNFHTDNIVGILKEINQIRFDVEDFIQQHDLNDRAAIYGVYEYMERAHKLFEDYASTHHIMAELLAVNGRQSDDDIIKTLSSVYKTTKIILSSLRRNEGKNSSRNLSQLKIHLKNFNNTVESRSYSGLNKTLSDDINTKVQSVINKMNEYETTGSVPIEDELYGPFYHYHNHILRYINWYGPGFIRSANDLIENLGLESIIYDEEPIIYKVLYPVKIDEIENVAATESKAIERERPDLNTRPLQFSNEPIQVEGNYIDLEIYDHQMMDRDSISVQFNNEWVLQDQLIGFTPTKLRLEIDDTQQNLLVIHAKNLGIIPPNTVAISYRYKGERKRVLIESNLEVSGAVEIVLEE